MKIIIPMAGVGKRMRPHTLTIPKPLIHIAGKPIVQHLVESLLKCTHEPVEEIAFVIGNFEEKIKEQLIQIAMQKGVKPVIYYQTEALGTAHAVYCAAESLDTSVIIAFADTLFDADIKITDEVEAVVWTSKVKDPSQFGVILTEGKIIKGFVEKPKVPVSDNAIIGVYYFKDGQKLKNEIGSLIHNKKKSHNEYQLTDALQQMLDKKLVFENQEVKEWLDCGNKNATIYANRRILSLSNCEKLVSDTSKHTNSIIIPPCYIGPGVELNNSIIGAYVSVGENTKIENSIITNSIIQNHSVIVNANIDNSMIGNYVEYREAYKELNIGDFTVIN